MMDDLAELQRTLTVQVLQKGETDASLEDRITQWEKHQQRPLERWGRLIAELRGAVFPKMGPLKVPPVSEVDGFNLDKDDRVSADTVFEWDVGDDPTVLVQISAGGGGLAVFCSAVDDGEFALPADIKQWLGDKTIPRPKASRESVVFYQIKDALVAVSQSTHY